MGLGVGDGVGVGVGVAVGVGVGVGVGFGVGVTVGVGLGAGPAAPELKGVARSVAVVAQFMAGTPRTCAGRGDSGQRSAAGTQAVPAGPGGRGAPEGAG